MKKEKYTVTGMTCAACSAAVERAVGKVEGVSSVTVNLLSNSMVVEYDENLLEPSQIVTAVSDAATWRRRLPLPGRKPRPGRQAVSKMKSPS